MPSFASLRKNMEWVRDQVRRNGITPTAKKAFSTLYDGFYDWTHGTETRKPAWSEDLVTRSRNKIHANRYQPSKARPFTRLLAELNLPRTAVFVDLGAGKGRVLLLAASYGFRRVIGVELCSNLSAQAVQNIGIFRKTRVDLPEIDVVNSDVVEYPLPDGDLAFYLNNSFGVPVLKEFLEKLRSAQKSQARRFWMIYSPPVHHSTIQEAGIFDDVRRFESGGVEFMIYAAGHRSGSTAA